jgi:hypothetical protein
MGEMDEDAVDRELATLGKVPIDDRIVFGDGSSDEVAAEEVGEREIGDDELEPAVVVEDVPADDPEGGFLMGEAIPQLQNGKWETYGQLGGLLLRNREYVDKLLRDAKLARGFARPNGPSRDLMNASAVLSRISWFVVSIEGNRATMATYYALFIKLSADLADMAITNRFARGVGPHKEARMDGGRLLPGAGRQPSTSSRRRSLGCSRRAVARQSQTGCARFGGRRRCRRFRNVFGAKIEGHIMDWRKLKDCHHER